jgi:hypothetical protein
MGIGKGISLVTGRSFSSLVMGIVEGLVKGIGGETISSISGFFLLELYL